MDRPVFERRFIRDGSVFQLWDRAGGNWEQLVSRDELREQLGPYARR